MRNILKIFTLLLNTRYFEFFLIHFSDLTQGYLPPTINDLDYSVIIRKTKLGFLLTQEKTFDTNEVVLLHIFIMKQEFITTEKEISKMIFLKHHNELYNKQLENNNFYNF